MQAPRTCMMHDVRPIAMSVLPPKADIFGVERHVCFGPEADISKEQKDRLAAVSPKTYQCLARSSLRGPRRQHCKCRGPRHQHCKYDRIENERRRISPSMTEM